MGLREVGEDLRRPQPVARPAARVSDGCAQRRRAPRERARAAAAPRRGWPWAAATSAGHAERVGRPPRNSSKAADRGLVLAEESRWRHRCCPRSRRDSHTPQLRIVARCGRHRLQRGEQLHADGGRLPVAAQVVEHLHPPEVGTQCARAGCPPTTSTARACSMSPSAASSSPRSARTRAAGSGTVQQVRVLRRRCLDELGELVGGLGLSWTSSSTRSSTKVSPVSSARPSDRSRANRSATVVGAVGRRGRTGRGS